MMMSKGLAIVCWLAGVSVLAAQPPKSNAPRQLPESPTTTVLEQAAEEKNKPVPALIKIKVPDNAVIWFENQKMSQGGDQRIFQSPALEMKKTYFYKVKVSWPTGTGTLAKDFVTEQEIAVKAGETTSVDFTPLVTHTKEVKPASSRDLIRQAAHATPAPVRNTKLNKAP